MHYPRSFGIATLLGLLSGSLQAADEAVLLASYNMQVLNKTGTQSTSPNTAAAVEGVTVGDFTENLTGGTSPAEFGVQNSGLVPDGVNGFSARSLNNSPSAPYWEFTLAPSAGHSLIFSSIELDASVAKTITGKSDWDYQLFWSVDGFTKAIGTFDGPAQDAVDSPQNAQALPLTPSFSHQIQNSHASAVTFRVVPVRMFGTNGAIIQRAGWIDNVEVKGAVFTNVRLLREACLQVQASLRGDHLTRRSADQAKSVNHWMGNDSTGIHKCVTIVNDRWKNDGVAQLKLFLATCNSQNGHSFLAREREIKNTYSGHVHYNNGKPIVQAFCIPNLDAMAPVRIRLK